MTEPELKQLVEGLPFVGHFGIKVVNHAEGQVDVEMPFNERFSAGPMTFPAAVVGAIGDVGAVASALSRLPSGWVVATMDFTVKLINPAVGQKLIAKGRSLEVGKTFSVSKSDIFVENDGACIHCATLLATSRNFRG